MTKPTFSNALSSWIIRVKIPSVTTSIFVRALILLSKRIRYQIDYHAFSPNKSAILLAIVFAANRRGSNMIIFLPSNQGEFNNANGKRVLFPAPGGALTIKVLEEDNYLKI